MVKNEKRLPEKRIKNKMMNVKLPEEDYRELQSLADELGGMSLSSMIRVLIYSRLEIVRKKGDPKLFLDINRK